MLETEAKTVSGCSYAERGAIYREIQEIFYDEQPYIWLYTPYAIHVISDRIGGVQAGPWNLMHRVHEWYVHHVINVEIDIKPGSDPNSINLGSRGVVPVAVLTTGTFDASTADPATVVFAGATPVRWAMEDVDDDGDLDLVLHFKTEELDLDVNSKEAVLTGVTFGGVPIQGTDTVNVVP